MQILGVGWSFPTPHLEFLSPRKMPPGMVGPSRFTSAGSNGPGNRTWPNGDMGVDGVSDDEARRWCSTDAGAYCCWCCSNRRWNCWWINASASAVFRCLGLCRRLASDAPPAAAYILRPAYAGSSPRVSRYRRSRRRPPFPPGRKLRHAPETKKSRTNLVLLPVHLNFTPFPKTRFWIYPNYDHIFISVGQKWV